MYLGFPNESKTLISSTDEPLHVFISLWSCLSTYLSLVLGRRNAGRGTDGWRIRPSARHSLRIQPRSPGRLFLSQSKLKLYLL